MKKKNYYKEALFTKQGKQLLALFLTGTVKSILICIFAAHTKLVYLALAFSMVAVSAVNNFTVLMAALKREDDNVQ